MATPEYLTVADCAEQIGVSKMTVYRMVADGKVASYRFGKGTIRIRTVDWEAFLSSGEHHVGNSEKP